MSWKLASVGLLALATGCTSLPENAQQESGQASFQHVPTTANGQADEISWDRVQGRTVPGHSSSRPPGFSQPGQADRQQALAERGPIVDPSGVRIAPIVSTADVSATAGTNGQSTSQQATAAVAGMSQGTTATPLSTGPAVVRPGPVVEPTVWLVNDMSPTSPAQQPIGARLPNSPGTRAANALETTASLTWQDHLREAVAALEGDLDHDSTLPEEMRRRREVELRLLYLMAGLQDLALSPINELEEEMSSYWSEQLFAIHQLLGDNGSHVTSHRAMLAREHLQRALEYIGETGKLELRNLKLCSSVDGFAEYEVFGNQTFRPGQELLVYVELDNFGATQVRYEPSSAASRLVNQRRKSTRTVEPLYETEFRASYQILDMEFREVYDYQLPLDKQRCRNRRRDYFIAYRTRIPEDLVPGKYRLQLEVEDVKRDKFGQAWIDFRVAN